MNADQQKALRAEFPPEAIGKLPKGGTLLDYVGHAATTDRLLSVDPDWTWEPMAVDQYGLPVFDNAGGLWIRLTVCGVTRLGYGDGKNPKEVIGDAIRNAAMRFGVALDLWAKEDLSNIAAAAPLSGSDEAGESTVADTGAVTPPTEPSDAEAVRDTASPASVPAEAGLAATADAGSSSGVAPAEGTAPDPTVAGVSSGEATGGEEGSEPKGVHEGSSGGSDSDYLSKEEQRVLKKALGGPKTSVDKARARFGDRIHSLGDLKRAEARELIEKEQAA